MGDRRRFEQIITNFLDNALRHNKGDSIEINIKENQRRANKVSLRIEVINNDGLIPDFLGDQEIETYTNLDNGDIEKTTSLSFSIARELAQLMDGEILIKPLETGGTLQVANIKLVFPIHDKEIIEETEETTKNSKIHLTDKVRTIIAEDNSVTQMTALKILVSTGNFDNRVFTDPKDLLEAVDKDDYDLILMSSSISQVDALELISLIKEFANDHNKKIPIIAVTTKTSAPPELVEYRKAGFKDVVKKPYTDDELLNTIYKRLNLKKFK
nr:hybrid sensor histidine kinase/response regulator [Nonlabens ulvanivorans]